MTAVRHGPARPMNPPRVTGASRAKGRRGVRAFAILFGGVALAAAAPADAVPRAANLTGWWANPTPNNAYLLDGHTEYVVSEQGSTTADGEWPNFGSARYIRTNGGSYGYGCASLRAIVEGARVVRIVSAASLPLGRCRSSVALKKAEPVIK